MNNKLYERIIVPGLTLIVLVLLLIFYQTYKDKSFGVSTGWQDAYRKGFTVSSTTVGLVLTNGVASSTQILAANPNRFYALCRNTNYNTVASVPVSINFGSSATTSIPIGLILSPAGVASSTPSYFEINRNNPYTGPIFAYATATSTIACVEN